MTPGKVILHGMKYPCRIGCTDAERAFAQTIEIDLECAADIGAAAASGSVKESICWETADSLLQSLCTAQEWILVEQLALKIADTVLVKFAAAEEVFIRIKKTPFSHGDWVGIELRRSRA